LSPFPVAQSATSSTRRLIRIGTCWSVLSIRWGSAEGAALLDLNGSVRVTGTLPLSASLRRPSVSFIIATTGTWGGS
jgi:hypothetical protein